MKLTPCGKSVLYCEGKNCPITNIWFDKEWDCPAYARPKKVEKESKGNTDLFWYT